MTRGPDSPATSVGSADDVRSRVIEVLEEGLNVDVPTDDTDLLETGRIDSLAFVELLLLIKAEFGVEVKIDDLDVENFRTASRITAFIEARRANGATPAS